MGFPRPPSPTVSGGSEVTHRCQHPMCFPDTTCVMGHRDRRKCEHWAADKEKKPVSPVLPVVSDIPWNSYALGTSDLSVLAGRGSPIVIGLVGASGSGKTSLLAFLYMWLLKSGELPGWSFSGSWTLGGWESLVHHSRWTAETSPSFPPHTSSSGRVPGLLHLSMRNHLGVNRDVLFTDAPGEWFTQWAKAPNDRSADGARWVITHADVLVMLVDRGALSSVTTLPRARQDTRDLLEQLGAACQDLPLALESRDVV